MVFSHLKFKAFKMFSKFSRYRDLVVFCKTTFCKFFTFLHMAASLNYFARSTTQEFSIWTKNNSITKEAVLPKLNQGSLKHLLNAFNILRHIKALSSISFERSKSLDWIFHRSSLLKLISSLKMAYNRQKIKTNKYSLFSIFLKNCTQENESSF
jgi:hypothetical protein